MHVYLLTSVLDRLHTWVVLDEGYGCSSQRYVEQALMVSSDSLACRSVTKSDRSESQAEENNDIIPTQSMSYFSMKLKWFVCKTICNENVITNFTHTWDLIQILFPSFIHLWLHFVGCRAITRTNVDLTSKVFSGIQLRAISQEAFMKLIRKVTCAEITHLKWLPHLSGANELK